MVYCRNCSKSELDCNLDTAKGLVDEQGKAIENPTIKDVRLYWHCTFDKGQYVPDGMNWTCPFYDPLVKVKQATLDIFA